MPCPICGGEVDGPTEQYPNLICDTCDSHSTNSNGDPPRTGREYAKEELGSEFDDSDKIRLGIDTGDNPVFIEGEKCWRRYRFGGWVTMLDQHDCETLDEFYEKHGFF